MDDINVILPHLDLVNRMLQGEHSCGVVGLVIPEDQGVSWDGHIVLGRPHQEQKVGSKEHLDSADWHVEISFANQSIVLGVVDLVAKISSHSDTIFFLVEGKTEHLLVFFLGIDEDTFADALIDVSGVGVPLGDVDFSLDWLVGLPRVHVNCRIRILIKRA